MKPVVAGFVDGLKPESVGDDTPFLATFAKRRMTSELGFSLTNYATMLTGTRVDTHHHWFLWRRRPESSPQRWMKYTGATWLPDVFVVHGGLNVLNRAVQKVRPNSAYFGVPYLFNTPARYWPLFDVVEKKFWDEDGFVPGQKTLFELLRDAGVAYEAPGMTKPDAERSIAVCDAHDYAEAKPFRYLFLGDIDPLSHRHTQEGAETKAGLRRLDAAVEKAFRATEAATGEEPRLVLWSDHGHRVVEEKLDLFKVFRDAGERLDRVAHFLDGNYARFWCRDAAERARVERVLATVSDNGCVVDDAMARMFRVAMPDNRFGDIVWHLDPPRLFSRTTWGFSSSVSTHGYVPTDPEMDAVVVSNGSFTAAKPHMVDVLPTLLAQVGVPAPSVVEGSSFLK